MMNNLPEYCLFWTQPCFTLDGWNDIAVIIATYIAVPGILFAAYKTFDEIKKSRIERENENKQKEREHLLKRIDFTLAQHRRLYDDPALYSVLALVDGDERKLAEPEMWDAKRKFLTFFEEIGLLVNAGQINSQVAYYMFGYYAIKAREGKNFEEGIDTDEKYWGVFYEFARNAEIYLEKCGDEDFRKLKF